MKFTNEQIEQGLDKIFDNLLQTKDVEASESMEITPDEGYAGIKKVNLTVKGGGGSGSGNKVYITTDAIRGVLTEMGMAESSISGALRTLMSFSSLICGKIMGVNTFATPGYLWSMGGSFSSLNPSDISALMYDMDMRFTWQGELVKFEDISDMSQIIALAPHITEEDFYNLNA